MLPHFIRFCVSMFIVLDLCQVSTSYKSIILPNSEQIIINEGETLRISCKDYPMKFVYPDNPEINTSYYFIHKYMENNIRIFERPKTVFSDTGWYGCSNHNEITTYLDDPQMTWLYVYVTSNRNAFVDINTNVHLNATVDDSIVIPCRTTSPHLQPILIKDKGDKVNKITYDPKFGFIIKNLSFDDSDSYKCLIKMNKKEYMVNYALSVQPKQILTEPIKTYDEYNKRVLEPYVNCTAEMEIYMRYVVDRNTRQQADNRKNYQQFRKYFNGYSILVKTLKLIEIEDENQMAYECNILTTYDKKKTTKEISTSYHEMDINYNTNFTFSMNASYYQNESANIEWDVLIIDSHIDDNIQWFQSNGEEIIQNRDNFISFEYDEYSKISKSHLQILRFSLWTISKNYILQVRNHNMTKNLNVKLDIIDEPICSFTFSKTYALLLAFNTYRYFPCRVNTNSPSNATWTFLKCPNYPSLENSTIVHLTNVTQSPTIYGFDTSVEMLIETSGKITCEACNEVGCDSVTATVLATDELGSFGMVGPKEPVLTGDNIELVCSASIYNYMDEFIWTVLVNRIKQPLIETERIKIVKHNTSFSYRSTLKFYNIQKSDATNYYCRGKQMDRSNYHGSAPFPMFDLPSGTYVLVIHDPVPPYFTKTNMNKTKTRIIDMMTEGQNTTILQCHADGMPKPIVTWYKDNVLLKKNDQYLFENNDQELHITYLTQRDSGKYSCRATSRLGTNETYQQITVKNTKWHILDVVLVISIPILSVILITSTIYFTIKILREKRKKKELIETGLFNFEEGALQCLDLKLAIDEQAELLPYDKKWEFPRDRLKLREQLGSGNFGVVMKAEAIGICNNKDITTVAVKMVRRSTDPIYIRALVSELKIMAHLGKHLNVVNLLGACTNNISKYELLMIVEYCCFGNLHNYLLRHRNDFINQINPKTRKHDFTIGMDILTRNVNVSNDNSSNGNSDIDVMAHKCSETNSDSSEINFSSDYVLSDDLSQQEWRPNHCNDSKDQIIKPICTQDLLSWAFQVARGMEYLSQRKILHGDLAARNILLTEDNIVKICDFGFAKIMYKEDNYKKKSSFPMPIKWMAMESIRNRIFSTQSDVWSFGIMLWEFFTLAQIPYPTIDITILHQKLIEGYRMEQPDYAVDEIYDIMLQCWIAKPTLRPRFTDLVESIGNLLEEGVKMHYITLNNPYMDINIMNLKSGKVDYLMMTSAPDYEVLSSIYKYENLLSKETSDSTYL